MNIFLIAGHGDGDSGAIGNGYYEADLTREVVSMLPEFLVPYADVTVGDTTRNWYEWLKTNSFNFRPYQYVLEVHFNAGVNDSAGNGKVSGAEAYVTTGEPGITVEEAILQQMTMVGYTNRGVKRKNFSVISKVQAQGVSAALLEVAFIDDKDDMLLYQSKKRETAQAIAQGIVQGFGLNTESGDLTMQQYEELNQRINELESRLKNAETQYNYIDENMPEWARPTIQKLVEKGFLQGNANGELGLSVDMMRIFVVNDRAGLYD